MNDLRDTVVVHEIFSAIQGEGLFVGMRQVLIRFHGCNLACEYCDTPASQGASPEYCRVEREAGSRRMDLLPNPLTPAQILGSIQRIASGYPHHSVSFTGGEPLTQYSALATLIPTLQQQGLPVYLETNGTLAEALSALVEAPQYIAMDIKLPSATMQPACWREHAAFLDTAMRRYVEPENHLQVKIIFGEAGMEDLIQAVELLASFSRAIPCILQPLTARIGTPASPSPATVLEAQRLAAARLSDVRVIPQTHVMLQQW